MMNINIGSRNWGIWAATAVCLAVAAGTVLYNVNQSERMPELIATRIQNTAPGVIVVRSGQVFTAQMEFEVLAGDRTEIEIFSDDTRHEDRLTLDTVFNQRTDLPGV
jgi:hypothetical protein